VKGQPDPFTADYNTFITSLSHIGQSVVRHLRVVYHGICAGEGVFYAGKKDSGQIELEAEEDLLGVDDGELKVDRPIEEWLEEEIFTQLSSHHPFISPATDVSSPFVKHILELLRRNGTRLFIHCGTAEWFYPPSEEFAGALKEAGVEVEMMREKGGYHVETCVFPGEFGGMSGRLVKGVVKWITEGSAGSEQ
jgi:acetyl esterase/lipase